MGRRITTEEREAMLLLRKAKYTCKEIADVYGVSVASVHKNTREELGVLRGNEYRGKINVEKILEEKDVRKGSWKGGTIGSSILSDETEDIVDSVKRYCDEHGMVELGFIGYTVGPIKKDDIVPTVRATFPIYVNFLKPETKEV